MSLPRYKVFKNDESDGRDTLRAATTTPGADVSGIAPMAVTPELVAHRNVHHNRSAFKSDNSSQKSSASEGNDQVASKEFGREQELFISEKNSSSERRGGNTWAPAIQEEINKNQRSKRSQNSQKDALVVIKQHSNRNYYKKRTGSSAFTNGGPTASIEPSSNQDNFVMVAPNGGYQPQANLLQPPIQMNKVSVHIQSDAPNQHRSTFNDRNDSQNYPLNIQRLNSLSKFQPYQQRQFHSSRSSARGGTFDNKPPLNRAESKNSNSISNHISVDQMSTQRKMEFIKLLDKKPIGIDYPETVPDDDQYLLEDDNYGAKENCEALNAGDGSGFFQQPGEGKFHEYTQNQPLQGMWRLPSMTPDKNAPKSNNKENLDGMVSKLKEFISESAAQSKRPKCIIRHDNKYKIYWDMIIMAILIFISIVVPFRLAFIENEGRFWTILYLAIDAAFGIDIILTFFTSIIDSRNSLEITSHCYIAKKYILSWFFLDVVSILPFDAILRDMQFNYLFRFARIGKLYKLIRMARLAKLLKMLKSNKTVINHMTEKLQINAGLERLIFFTLFFFFFIHISACLYVLLVQFEEHEPVNWLSDYQYMGIWDIYILAVYFVLTTVSTVGYGDVASYNTTERIFCMILMVIGVSCFSFISGALASILSTYDSSQTKLQEKLLFLSKLKTTSNISERLYLEIRRALNFDQKQNREELHQFTESLPLHLQLDLSIEVYQQKFKKFDMFSKIGNKHFLTWIGTSLKPQFFSLGQKVYQPDDDIDNFYFMTTGKASFVMPGLNNRVYAVVDPDQYLKEIKHAKKKGLKRFQTKIFQHFGLEDSVFNHTKLILDTKTGFIDDPQKESLSKRVYCVQIVKAGEALTLTHDALDRMRRDFQGVARFHCHCIQKISPENRNNQLSPEKQLASVQPGRSGIFTKNGQSNAAQMLATQQQFQMTQVQQSIVDMQINGNSMYSDIEWSASSDEQNQSFTKKKKKKQNPNIKLDVQNLGSIDNQLDDSPKQKKSKNKNSNLKKTRENFQMDEQGPSSLEQTIPKSSEQFTSFVEISAVRSGTLKCNSPNEFALEKLNSNGSGRERQFFPQQRSHTQHQESKRKQGVRNYNLLLPGDSAIDPIPFPLPQPNLRQQQSENSSSRSRRNNLYSDEEMKQSSRLANIPLIVQSDLNQNDQLHPNNVNQSSNIPQKRQFSLPSDSSERSNSSVQFSTSEKNQLAGDRREEKTRFVPGFQPENFGEGRGGGDGEQIHSQNDDDDSDAQYELYNHYEQQRHHEQSRPKKWALSQEEIENIKYAAANPALNGFGALATVIRLAQSSKIRYQLQNPCAFEEEENQNESRLAKRLKRNLIKRMEEVNFDEEMANCIKDKESRNEVLNKLIEEQNFRISANTINQQDKVAELLDTHMSQMTEIVDRVSQRMRQMTDEIKDVNEKVNELQSVVKQNAMTNKLSMRLDFLE